MLALCVSWLLDQSSGASAFMYLKLEMQDDGDIYLYAIWMSISTTELVKCRHSTRMVTYMGLCNGGIGPTVASHPRMSWTGAVAADPAAAAKKDHTHKEYGPTGLGCVTWGY